MKRILAKDLEEVFKDGYGGWQGYGDRIGCGNGSGSGYGDKYGDGSGHGYGDKYSDGSGYGDRNGGGDGAQFLKPLSYYVINGLPIQTLESTLSGDVKHHFVGVFLIDVGSKVEEISESEYLILKMGGT